MAIYYGRNRSTTYILGKQLNSGGEGEVYEIDGKSGLVAKIYFDHKFSPTAQCQDPRQEMKEKIETMLDQPVNPYLNGVLSVAWPQDILTDAQGKFMGYTMPRVNGKHHIYAASRERERVQLYPSYTWKTAILIAYNLALAVKIIHNSGAVVGDMNPNNIMLDEKGHVTLIDTDSFNITNRRTGKTYKCSVGVPEMLPAELQGKDLANPNHVFTRQTDSFALSIHIFNLLMNNCHPFGCVGMNKSQSSSSNNPVVHNIVKGHCPYVTNGTGETSPDAPDVMMLPREIRQLFDRAFSYSTVTAVQSATIANRPSPQEWQDALSKLYNSQMAECRKGMPHLHLYPAGYSNCPWCAIAAKKQIKPKSPTPIRNQTHTNTGVNIPPARANTGTGSSGSKIRRGPAALWWVCILCGVISGPLMADLLMMAFQSTFNIALPPDVAYMGLLIIGGIVGAVIAHFGQESYETAYNGWPWLLLGLLVPVVTILSVAALMLIGALVVAIVTIVIQIIVAIAIIAGLCGMCTDG